MPVSLDQLAARIADGAQIVVPPDYAGPSLAATHALVRRGARGLRLVAAPTSGMQADILIGAGCVASVEAAAVGLGEHGFAPRFTEAVKAGALAMLDATCPAIHAALQASEKGVPFMPLRGLVGSDLLARRREWMVVDNPFAAGGDQLVLLPAIRPDVALFHARYADAAGNVWIGRNRELATMAHASATALVTVEEMFDGDLLADDAMAPGTLPTLYVGAVAVAKNGAWPVGLAGVYPRDDAEIARYARSARTAAGFAEYLRGAGARAA